MTTLDKNIQPQASSLAKAWQRTPVLIRAILMTLVVGIVGANGIVVFSITLPPSLALIATLAYLFLYWKFFSGSWGPKKTAETRKKYFRAGRLSPTLWKWSLLLGALFVLLFQSSLVVMFRLIQFPADLFEMGFGFESLPLWMAWAFIIIAALSAALTEEVGFRGYGQVPLEERYGPFLAIIIIAVLFVIVHLNQAWLGPMVLQMLAAGLMAGAVAYATGSLLPGIIAHTVVDIINFSYWWSDIAGKFEYQPIAITGVDLHFVVWSVIFAASVVLSFLSFRKVKAVRLQS
ncbi:MAG: type II CAAX endopeptidase family protein [Leptospirales bacterium]